MDYLEEQSLYFIEYWAEFVSCEACGRQITYITLSGGRRIPLQATDDFSVGYNHYLACPELRRRHRVAVLRAERKARGPR